MSRRGGFDATAGFFVTLLVLSLVLLALAYALDIPDVYRSWSTGECVRVHSPRPSHTCTNLPPRFRTVWVR